MYFCTNAFHCIFWHAGLSLRSTGVGWICDWSCWFDWIGLDWLLVIGYWWILDWLVHVHFMHDHVCKGKLGFRVLHSCSCVYENWVFIWEWNLGACVSRPQAEMGHYLGGAPLVTRERNILSNVPWIVAGRQWDRTRDSCRLRGPSVGGDKRMSGHERAGRGTGHRYEVRTCGWSLGEIMVHRVITD